jgi:hypothetical protein
MQYLLIICHDDSFTPTKALIREIVAWDKERKTGGIRKYGNPLRPPSNAITVPVRKGDVVLKNSPFAKSKQKMAVYELIQCASLEEAVDIGFTHPMTKAATIEVRPI